MRWIFFLFLLAQGPAEAGPLRVVFLGDSLTAGYGVAKDKAFPALLGEQLSREFPDLKIKNASISGSTSASGPGRMKWVLKGEPEVVFLALGANDGLRGQPVENLKKNLLESIRLAKKEKVEVVLGGQQIPLNYGETYTKKFKKIYQEVAEEQDVTFVPFLLKGVAGEKDMNIEDGIHPNEKGHERIAKTVKPYLKKVLKNVKNK